MSQHRAPPDTGFPTGLLLEIDRAPGARIRSQLETALRGEIQGGRIQPGTKLPPTRTLARELGIARSVVVEVYAQLAAEGFIDAVQGAGTRVRAQPQSAASEPRPVTRPALSTPFATGLPDPAYFPQRHWLRAYSSVFTGPGSQPLGCPDPRGRAELRTALAGHLSRVRGLRTCPSQLLICNGVTHALTIIARALRARGVTRIGIEDPCFAAHRRLIASLEIQPVPIAVDAQGLLVGKLSEVDVDAVLVAPAHSYPTGAVLSRTRRRDLISWARRNDTLIIEDDYDAEFRFDASPIGALQSLAPENVLYAGSVNKVLDPALQIGWISVPPRLAPEVLEAKLIANTATETFGQLALARFVEDGGLARHIRRVRPRYRARRDRLLAELHAQAPGLRPKGADVGLHLYLPLPAEVREADVTAAAKQDGLDVEGSAKHWANWTAGVPAVLIGYGTMNETTVERDVRTLAAAILQPNRRHPPRALQDRTAALTSTDADADARESRRESPRRPAIR